MPFSNPAATIRFGLPKSVQKQTEELRKQWSSRDLEHRRREAVTVQRQLALLAACAP